jgi:ATP adenylyltransferase
VTGQIKEEGCIFCNRLHWDDEENFILYRGKHWYIILNLFPYNNGHLLLVVNRHIPALNDCTSDELLELSRLLQNMEETLNRAYQPHGINCGYNGGASAGAGVPEHFHFHMLPRWSGDTSFMTTIGQTRVMPQDLSTTYAQLKPILAAVIAERE